MRRLPILILSLLVIVALAACSSGGAPGWTYAPAPSATPVASGPASGAPSGGPSAAPSSPPAAGSPAPSGVGSAAPSGAAGPAPSGAASPAPSGGAAALTVSAPVGSATSGWVPPTLETAAASAFTLIFDNQDNTAPHNLVIQNPDGTAVAVEGDTAIFTGPGQRTYQVPALTAGAYTYIYQVHQATMVGTLTVK